MLIRLDKQILDCLAHNAMLFLMLFVQFTVQLMFLVLSLPIKNELLWAKKRFCHCLIYFMKGIISRSLLCMYVLTTLNGSNQYDQKILRAFLCLSPYISDCRHQIYADVFDFFFRTAVLKSSMLFNQILILRSIYKSF